MEIKSSSLRGEKITFHTGNLPGCLGIVHDSDAASLLGFMWVYEEEAALAGMLFQTEQALTVEVRGIQPAVKGF